MHFVHKLYNALRWQTPGGREVLERETESLK